MRTENIYICDICNEEFYTYEDCYLHEEDCKSKKNGTCKYCIFLITKNKEAVNRKGKKLSFTNYDCELGYDTNLHWNKKCNKCEYF